MLLSISCDVQKLCTNVREIILCLISFIYYRFEVITSCHCKVDDNKGDCTDTYNVFLETVRGKL